MFLSSSHQVPHMSPRFPMRSPRVFPIAPCFNPICFAQSPLLLTYIGGQKGEAFHLSRESLILGSLHSFNFFFAMGQSNWLIEKKKKKRVGIVRIILKLVYVESQSASLKSSSLSPIFRGFMISCHLNCICYFCVNFATLKMCWPTRCFAISCHVKCNTSYFYVHIAISCHVSCNTSYF